ncbi:MAG TPA: tetratricopeptide repeat protein, partial [Cytophagaceae bacterium]|nr:tetratricopeptide repeat protein [Cytophagaceae bacterium]
MNLKIQFYFTLLIVFLSLNISLAQDRDVEIANEYFGTAEYDKAKDMYERLSKNNVNLPFIYDNYLFTLLHFKQKEEAEKFIRKMIKVSDDNLFYKLDHYTLVTEMNGEAKTEKEFSGIVNDIKDDEILVEKATDYLLKKGLYERAKTIFLASRKSLRNNSLYVIPMSGIYYKQGNVDLSIEELLSFLKNNPDELESVKNVFQNNLKEEKDFELLEKKLYERVQKEPDEIAYNELLLWMNLQKKNFSRAYLQAKAIDKRLRTEGNKMMTVGRIAMENKDYENASRFFEYVIKEYPDGINYP